MSDEKTKQPWNIACSYGCHDWVKAGEVVGPRYLKGCRNCDASYFCSRATWDNLPELIER